MSQKFLPIRVSTLRGDQPIDFSAYVHVAEKYILFCRAGDSFEGDRLNRLREKNLRNMYVRAEDLPKYEAYLTENLRRAYDEASGKSISERTEIIHGVMQAAAEDLIESLDDEAKYKLAVSGAQRFLNFISNDPEALKAVLTKKSDKYNPVHHGVTVSALAVAIAEELGIKEARPQEVDLLAVGCMIHDLEHHYAPVEHAYPEAEAKAGGEELFLKHTSRGAKRIEQGGVCEPLVDNIVRYAGETIDGSGPYEKKQNDLDPLVFVAAAANSFGHIMQHEDLQAKEALKKILVDKMGVYPLETLQALQGALKKRGIV